MESGGHQKLGVSRGPKSLKGLKKCSRHLGILLGFRGLVCFWGQTDLDKTYIYIYSCQTVLGNSTSQCVAADRWPLRTPMMSGGGLALRLLHKYPTCRCLTHDSKNSKVAQKDQPLTLLRFLAYLSVLCVRHDLPGGRPGGRPGTRGCR